MSKIVRDFGITALQKIATLSLPTNLDIPQGKLVGVTGGKLVLATNATGAYVRAIGLVVEGSEQEFGEAFALNPERPLREGKYMAVEKQFVVEGDFSALAIGDKIYLGVDGAYTATPIATTGALLQQVGFVLSAKTAFIDLTKDTTGTEVA